MAPFNISSVSIDLPYWASAYSSLVYKEPTLETQTTEPQHQLFSPVIVIILIFIAIVLVVAGLLIYHKKNSGRQTT
jgi:heme/copper-type cytochrome/quinol oxidase subunit 2